MTIAPTPWRTEVEVVHLFDGPHEAYRVTSADGKVVAMWLPSVDVAHAIATAANRLAAVRALHAETACEEDCCRASACCTECGPGLGWPCPTIAALDTE